MNRILCIDGGATKTIVRAVSADGRVLGQSSGPSTSLNYDIHSIWDTLRHLVSDLEHDSGHGWDDADWRRTRIFAAMAGTEVRGAEEAFRASAPEGAAVDIISDGLASLIAAHGVSVPGAVLSIGTGSVCFWRNDRGDVGRRGGWGFPLGDEGGGAWIGLEALRACLAEMQAGDASLSAFSEAVSNRIGPCESPSNLASWVAGAKASMLADLAPVVFAHAPQNEDAARILTRAADHVLDLTENLQIGGGTVALMGGVGSRLWHFLPPDRRESISLCNAATIDGVTAWAISETAKPQDKGTP